MECAVCGLKVEAPDGDQGVNNEVEAAHIQRAADGGPDKLPDRIILCRLHHWAFDNGWIAPSDEHRILVKDAPNRAGYEEFVPFEGEQIRLPENLDIQPHPHFLEIHREEHGFEPTT